ncbi:DUF3857 domain-containing protein [Flavobacteriaceae bacterium SZ-1-7]|uniref:DUF3857 domain-containing protein n=1 Tax=Tamlana sedimenti TaxID=3134126 RepID=UPI0031259BD8
MSKNLFTVVLFLTFSILTFSQPSEEPIFRVSLSDLKMTSYPKDSTANAIVLYEFGNSFVDENDYKLHTEEKYKIKIFNKEGFENATITIPLREKDNNSFDKIENIVATTYNLEGEKVTTTKLNKENIYKEKHEYYSLVKFTLPNLREGSVITYSYTTITPFMFNYKSWDFQSSIPKLYSEYCASIPGNWDYNIKLIGGKKLFINETKVKKECLRGGNGGVAHCFDAKYAMKDIPAFIEENHMTSKSNYLARIEYELKSFTQFNGVKESFTKTWEDVDKELKKEKTIGRQLAKSIKIEEILPTTILNETEPLTKAKSIYRFVQENYTWNEEFRIFRDVSVKDLIQEKSGNATVINILLKILLEETGIKTNPVLLSTRGNGFSTKLFPVISEFNYLIVQSTINNKTFLLDATDPFLSFGDLPFRCLNQYARLLDFKNGSKWIEIEPQSLSRVMYDVEMNFDEDQKLVGKVKSKRTGYHALKYKKAYYPNPAEYKENLTNNAPYLEIMDHTVTEDDVRAQDFSEVYKFEYHPENTGENIYLNPFFVKFFNENPFKLQERTYPIDFGYKDDYIYIFKLNLGEKYTVAEKPKDFRLALPSNTGEIGFSTKIMNNSVVIVMKFDFKSAMYSAEFYPYLKEYMGKIVDIQKNSLLLLKKI